MRRSILERALCVAAFVALANLTSHALATDLSTFFSSVEAKPHLTVDAMKSYMDAKCQSLTATERQQIWNHWLAGQAPDITKDDLLALVSSKQKTISNIKLKYSIVPGETFSPDGAFGGIRFEFFATGNMARLDTFRSDSGRVVHTTQAYDGTAMRRLLVDNGDGNSMGDVGPFQSRSPFYKSFSPLAQCMLVNTNNNWDQQNQAYDLSAFLEFAHVLDSPQQFNGTPALAVIVLGTFGVPNAVVYLDPKMDFAVLRYVSYESNQDGLLGKIAYQRDMEDFKEYGQSIWIPSISTEEWFQTNHRKAGKMIVKTDAVELDRAIPKEVFGDSIFPNGTRINDPVTKQVTIKGAEADNVARVIDSSMNHLHNLQSDSRTPELAQTGTLHPSYIVALVVGALACAVTLYLFVRKRGKTHSPSET